MLTNLLNSSSTCNENWQLKFFHSIIHLPCQPDVDVDPNCERIETCSNIVLTRKTDCSLRMNIDATPINRAAAEVMHPHMTTPEEVRHKPSGSTRFSEFDMNHGYNQSTLSEESCYKYAVFQTHKGFHRFTSLYFGHCQAAEAFDKI